MYTEYTQPQLTFLALHSCGQGSTTEDGLLSVDMDCPAHVAQPGFTINTAVLSCIFWNNQSIFWGYHVCCAHTVCTNNSPHWVQWFQGGNEIRI